MSTRSGDRLRGKCGPPKLSAGLPSAMLRRGTKCDLKIDIDGIRLTGQAARFRVACRSSSLSTGLARILAATEQLARTLDSLARAEKTGTSTRRWPTIRRLLFTRNFDRFLHPLDHGHLALNHDGYVDNLVQDCTSGISTVFLTVCTTSTGTSTTLSMTCGLSIVFWIS